MSVLKNLDIDLPQSEKKTLFRFLSLYIVFTLITLGLISSLYYNLQKELLIKEQTIELNQYSNEFLIKLKDLKQEINQTIDINDKYKISLYDTNFNIVYSTLAYPKAQLDQITYTINKSIRYIKNPNDYYLNTQYIIVEIKNTNDWTMSIYRTIFIYGVLFFIFMLILGYFLLNLFLKPMKDALHLLDRFIKDTTHELNTPISTIMTNIELIDREKIKDKFLLKTINRIDIGAKTISNIYDDLTFLLLNNKIISNNRDINISNLITQRIEYFMILINMKKITISINLEDNIILYIDENKFSKLFDNILSNAIKYNKIGGTINIKLCSNSFSIEDSGQGISDKNIAQMFNRYARFDTNVGGFGIGLNIVKMISQEYNLYIKIESKLKQYTKFTIKW